MDITPENLPIIVAGAFFLCLLLLLLGFALYIRQSKKREGMIQKIRQTGTTESFIEQDTTPIEIGGRFQKKISGFFSEIGKRVPASDKIIDYDKLRPMFLKAGIRRQNAAPIFWGTKIFLSVFLPIGVLVAEFAFPGRLLPTGNLVLALAFLAILGFYLPNLWLLFKTARRKEMIVNGFPDALDLMVVCVEAGMGLDSAITRVSKEIELNNKVLSDELNIYNLEMRGGKLRRDALKNLATRTDVPEVNNLATLLIQTDKFGTSIGQALKVYSDTMRTQRFQRAEERAAKIPVKLIFPLILFIFPALFVAILGPAAINIYRVFIKGSF